MSEEEIKKTVPIAKKKKGPELDPFVASMLPESDKRMAGFSGTFAVLAIVLGFMASMYEAAVDEILFENIESEDLSASMKIDEKKEEKKKEEKKSEKPRKKQGAGGKPRGKGQPNAPQTRGVLKMLTAKSSKSNFSAYNLMKDKNFAKDIDKVLKNVAGLQTSGKTELGSRRGSATGGFNDGYAEGGSGGIGDMLGGLMGGSAGGIGTSAKGTLKAPSQRDIDMGSGDGSRSKADIMAVVNQRMPGLRRIYNQHLKTNPGLTGKVTIKFTIAPGGDIISINIVSSTTGDSKFDEAIKNAVATWKWKVIKSGNTTPTIPFNFSE